MWLKTLRLLLQETLYREGDLQQRVSERLDKVIGDSKLAIMDKSFEANMGKSRQRLFTTTAILLL